MAGGACVAGRAYIAGGHAWWVACMDGEGACMSWGHAWQRVCMAGGVHGRGHAWQGSMCGGGCAWQGACMAVGGHACPWQILQDTVNEQEVCILLECILV